MANLELIKNEVNILFSENERQETKFLILSRLNNIITCSKNLTGEIDTNIIVEHDKIPRTIMFFNELDFTKFTRFCIYYANIGLQIWGFENRGCSGFNWVTM